MENNRRDFLKKTALFTANIGVWKSLPEVFQKALDINPAVGSTFEDAEHVVFLMQENRSFDHAFGTMKGVRGFNDPRAIKLPSGLPVWFQADKAGNTYVPFRLGLKETKSTWMHYLPHTWYDQIEARNNGLYNQWIDAKRSDFGDCQHIPMTMGYYNRSDIPFYYALADAFTVCDHNFCSSLTGTSPNRSYFWTGTLRKEQTPESTPHLQNHQIDGPERLDWKTFPERLQENGIDWKIYQNELSFGVGFDKEKDNWLANFGDNTIESFKNFHAKSHLAHKNYVEKRISELENLTPEKLDDKAKKELAGLKKEWDYITKNALENLSAFEQELHKRAFVTNKKDPNYHEIEKVSYDDNGVKREMKVPKGDILYQFREDVNQGKLPTVSWLVPPCNFSDHPDVAWYGAWYISEVMEILTKNPEVWKKTIFIITYDENDGFFDHFPPFVAPNPKDPETGKVSASVDISSEFVTKQHSEVESSIGLGYRVPMMIISPWSRGGYVNSQVFDHTSSLQFLEYFIKAKTGKDIKETNISSYRRALCGNLTSAFRPYNGEKVSFPQKIDTKSFMTDIHKAQFKKMPDNFKALSQDEIKLILDKKAPEDLFPRQEIGIKPSNSIPVEPHVDALLVANKFEINLKAGNQFFGKKAAGLGFHVYAANKCKSYVVAAGEKVSDNWDLNLFVTKKYDVSVYSNNGFYRHYTGNHNDPKLKISLEYQSPNHRNENGDNIFLHIQKTESKKPFMVFVKDKIYKNIDKKIQISSLENEIWIPINVKKSHHWYDLEVIVEDYPDFKQHYAGQSCSNKSSFSDPYMGGVLKTIL